MSSSPTIKAQLDITQGCAAAISALKGSTGTVPVVLILDAVTDGDRGRVALSDAAIKSGRHTRAAWDGLPAFIRMHEAVFRLAGIRFKTTDDALSLMRRENDRIERLIASCLKERESDARHRDFPRQLPTIPVAALISRIEESRLPWPPSALALLRTAKRILAVRTARERKLSQALADLLEAARGGALDLWAGTTPTATAEVVQVPRSFLLRNITTESSWLHLALAHHRENPTSQRAIVAPDGPRSVAYYDVRIERAAFLAVFARLLRERRSDVGFRTSDAEVRTWYRDVYVPACKDGGTTPSHADDESAARRKFQNVVKLRNIVRDCRRDFAPPHWHHRGPRKKRE